MTELAPRLLGLGHLDLRQGRASLSLGPHKQRALLALLALYDGQVVPTDRIIDGIWGDDPPPTASTAVQVYISGLRKLLRATPGLADLRTHAPGYRLVIEPGAFDVPRFEALVGSSRAAEQTDPLAALDGYEQALALWRGTPLADCPEPFAIAPRQRLEEFHRLARTRRLHMRLATGQAHLVVPEAEAALDVEPFDEDLWGLLARALYVLGRQADALSTFRRARRVLADELGVDPGPELAGLERQVLNHDPRLTSFAGVARPAAAPRPGSRSLSAPGSDLLRSGSQVPGVVTPEGIRLPLVSTQLTIGRRQGCDIVLDDPNVSRQHCRLLRSGGRHVVIDDSSTNGTSINGTPIPVGEPGTPLVDGDRLEIAGFTLRYEIADPGADISERTIHA